MRKPRVCIVTPALAEANTGNWHTASRWQRFLAPVAEVEVVQHWAGHEADALIALHARRSADSIARFHAAHPGRPLALVLTGTDLYRDLEQGDESARHALECASHVAVLQDEALHRLDGATCAKARVIVQSAMRVQPHAAAPDMSCFVAVGHLRDEKDPLTLMRAVRRLPAGTAIRVVHIGRPLDDALADAARRTMAECPRYQWLPGLPPAATRRRIAGSAALVHMSRMEGGANVVIEAVRSGVPVLASRIDGNVGLLGRDYAGYFEAGDDAGLAALMQRFAADPAFAQGLAAQCARQEPRFRPAAERAAVRRLLADMLAQQGQSAAATIDASSSLPSTAP
jgi:putative glycosyltransferase (TIGR04348 family)